ncbi:hypothetical protein LUX33_42540 [Actinomadura madurae]|nr:hypothetical protein [Actinomadura madurae]MCP9954422.1 hypothetical protein [Actinomadura madurae]
MLDEDGPAAELVGGCVVRAGVARPGRVQLRVDGGDAAVDGLQALDGGLLRGW